MLLKTHLPAYKIFDLPIPIPGHEAVSHLFLIQSQKTALIDTGPASTLPHLFSQLAVLNIHPDDIDYVLGTHIHLDHLGGLNQTLKRMPRTTVVVHPKGIPHLVQPQRLWQASLEMSGETALKYGQPEPVAAEKLIAAGEGQMIDLGGIRLEILFTPGHAPHHLSFLDRQNANLFAGESAGIYFPDSGIIRPAAPPPFDIVQSLNSLDKMIAAQPDTVYYCHYGFTGAGLENLLKFRAQLLLWNEVISHFFTPGRELSDDLIETILDSIVTKDGTKAQMPDFKAERLKAELYFMRNNVRGYWECLQRSNQVRP